LEIRLYESVEQNLQSFAKKLAQEALHKVIEQSAPIAARIKENATVHEWLHIRSLYFADPEGNLLEFVCYDESAR